MNPTHVLWCVRITNNKTRTAIYGLSVLPKGVSAWPPQETINALTEEYGAPPYIHVCKQAIGSLEECNKKKNELMNKP